MGRKHPVLDQICVAVFLHLTYYNTSTEKTKLTVTSKDQTIAFGAAISQASSKYTIKGLQTGDKATVTLKTDTKKYRYFYDYI